MQETINSIKFETIQNHILYDSIISVDLLRGKKQLNVDILHWDFIADLSPILFGSCHSFRFFIIKTNKSA